ncbi:MAG: right-handed parallel beta-helix repeat-containing protein [Candidatus Thorarchaeota archaeon]
MNGRSLQLVLLIFLMITSTSYNNIQPANLETIDEPEGLSAKYETHFPIYIDTEDDFSYFDIPGSGTSEDPYIIENNNITSAGSCINIELDDIFYADDMYVVIRNCFFSSPSTSYGLVTVHGLTTVTIENCIFVGGQIGIRLDWYSRTTGASIINNTITNMEIGIRINNVANGLIENNSVYNCLTGMQLTLDNSSVLNNKIYGNSQQGIQFSEYSENNTIQGNEFGWNGGYYGFGGVDNAEDYGANNTWNGNSWSDYTGLGTYDVDGPANSEDNQPTLLVDTDIPQIVEPDDQSVLHGETGHSIIWDVSDEFPFEYSISINGNKSSERTWLGYSIETSLDDLPIGSYQISLNVTDCVGNSNSTTVLVEVIQPLFDENIVITLIVIGIVAVVIIGFEISRRRKLP